jgi:DNA polymerase alpha-binding protein Ctf4
VIKKTLDGFARFAELVSYRRIATERQSQDSDSPFIRLHYMVCMKKKVLPGHVMKNGAGDASNWDIDAIRRVTGRGGLQRGTLNVKVDGPHKLRPEYQLSRNERADKRDEDLYFESCVLVMDGGTVAALIARTSTNHWGDEVLEIMAEQHLRSSFGLKDNDRISVEIWVDADAAGTAHAESVLKKRDL